MLPLARVIVVLPARNEELRLPTALAALDRTQEYLRSMDDQPPEIQVWVVTDRCDDRTEQIAEGWPGVRTVRTDHGRVGAARAAGVEYALRTGSAPGSNLADVWIACSDADSQVPPDWLATHVRHAGHGVEMLLGTVRPDPAELTPHALARWHLQHELGDGHRHIHGANLGIRADVYVRAGAFEDVSEHEDIRLAERVRGLGGVVVSTGDSPVLTSARTVGRTPGGMAGYLLEMSHPQTV